MLAPSQNFPSFRPFMFFSLVSVCHPSSLRRALRQEMLAWLSLPLLVPLLLLLLQWLLL
jgi:hypothetical protein